MDVAQYMGLDMKDETTILAWRVEECDEFYFCGSVMYVYLTSAVAKKKSCCDARSCVWLQ